MREEYSNRYRRWYDRDPILQRSMQTLENSDDESQIKIALNLIKIIIEHNISNDEYNEVGDILSAVEEGQTETQGNRWYDLNSTVRTAINMLENCPFSTQKAIAKEMAKLVVDKIKENDDNATEEF